MAHPLARRRAIQAQIEEDQVKAELEAAPKAQKAPAKKSSSKKSSSTNSDK